MGRHVVRCAARPCPPARGSPPRGVVQLSTAKLIPDLLHFQRVVIIDSLLEASRGYWLRRAADFDAVGTPECDETAQACRNRAAVSLLGGDWPEADDVLGERRAA